VPPAKRCELLAIFTINSINGTSINTPTTVVSAVPDRKSYKLMAVAAASSKKLLATIGAEGAATQHTHGLGSDCIHRLSPDSSKQTPLRFLILPPPRSNRRYKCPTATQGDMLQTHGE